MFLPPKIVLNILHYNQHAKYLPVQSKQYSNRKRCGMCLKLTVNTLVFIVIFKHILHLFLLLLLLTLNK